VTDQPLHSIGAVARHVGVSPHVLRAWERRYGVVEPARTEGGTRLYTESDILRLRLLRQATDQGSNIGSVAGLSIGELAAMLRPASTPRALAEASEASEAEHFVARTLDAVRAMDASAAQGLLRTAMVALRTGEFLNGVILPVLHGVGEDWEEGRVTPAHEHLFSTVARSALSSLLDALPPEPDAPTLLSTTPAGQMHEFGAMLAAVVAAEDGWRVAHLGPDLPYTSVAAAARLTGARIVALGVVCELDPEAWIGEARALRRALPDDVVLVIGGAGIRGHERSLEAAGIVVLTDLELFRATLRTMRGRAGGAA
jgi:MerR family transcriptional regulator, light-induced transcriptional regulator